MKWQIYLSLLIVLGLHLGLFISMPNEGYTTDLECWNWWIETIEDYGLENCYQEAQMEYPPVYIHLLNASRPFMDFEADLTEQQYIIKRISVFFSLMCGLFVIFFLHKTNRNPLWALWLVLNPALLYNFYIWGQLDVIYTAFLLMAFVLLMHRHPLWANLCFLLAVNTKVQSVIFIPFFVVLMIALVQKDGKMWGKLLLTGGLLQLILFLPFLFAEPQENMTEVSAAVTTSIDRYDNVSYHAWNHWFWWFDEPFDVSDTEKWGFLSLKNWGLLLAFTNLTMLGLRVLVILWKRYQQKALLISPEWLPQLLLLLSLANMAFFFFPTQIHSRYIHASVLFLAFIPFISPKKLARYALIACVCLSVSYFLNMESEVEFWAWKKGWSESPIPQIISLIVALVYAVGWLYPSSTIVMDAVPPATK